MSKATSEKTIDDGTNTFHRGPVICTVNTPELGLLVAPTAGYHEAARAFTKKELDEQAAWMFNTAPDYWKGLKKELVACACAARLHELSAPGAN